MENVEIHKNVERLEILKARRIYLSEKLAEISVRAQEKMPDVFEANQNESGDIFKHMEKAQLENQLAKDKFEYQMIESWLKDIYDEKAILREKAQALVHKLAEDISVVARK